MASQPYRTTPAPAVATTRRHSGAGFTLVELLVTVTIVSILLAIGVPNLTDFIRNTRVRSATFDLLSDLNFARSEAIKGGSGVTLCKSTDGIACSTGTAGYETGWLVFSDCNTNGALDSSDCDGDGINESEPLLRAHAALSNVTLKGNTNIANRITFRANGRANPIGTYSLCLGTELRREVVVSLLGQIRLETYDEPGETPLTCP